MDSSAAGDVDVRECAICLETFQDPRILPCMHTYCSRCIRHLCIDKKPGDDAACPICREAFTIPETGVDGLPENHFIEQLLEKRAKSSSPSRVMCSSAETPANELAGNKEVMMFCIECDTRVSDTCTRHHQLMKKTRTHQLAEISDVEDINRFTAEHCGRHPEFGLELYCHDCGQAVCNMCFTEQHETHIIENIDDVADEFREQFTYDSQRLIEAVPGCRKIIAELKHDDEGLARTIKNIEAEINLKARERKEQFEEQMEQLRRGIETDNVQASLGRDSEAKRMTIDTIRKKQQVDEDAWKLLNEVWHTKTARWKQTQTVIAEVEQHISSNESLANYVEELMKVGAASDVVQQYFAIRRRIEQLLNLDNIRKAVSALGSIDVTFTPAPWPTNPSSNIVGTFEARIEVAATDDVVKSDGSSASGGSACSNETAPVASVLTNVSSSEGNSASMNVAAADDVVKSAGSSASGGSACSNAFTMEPKPTSFENILEEARKLMTLKMVRAWLSGHSGERKPEEDISSNVAVFPRLRLLLSGYCSYVSQRCFNHVTMLLMGESGHGKSSTINHLFGVDIAQTSNAEATTRSTTEYIITADDPSLGVSDLSLGLVDTPGWGDTDGIEQDACNLMSLKTFCTSRYSKQCFPNILLILVQATDTRLSGRDSNFVQTLRVIDSFGVVDKKHPNVVVAVTFACSIPKKTFTSEVKRKSAVIKAIVHEHLKVEPPVVWIENNYADNELKISADGQQSYLYDGTMQPNNLFLAITDVLVKNQDDLGLMTFCRFFELSLEKRKNATMGECVMAKKVIVDGRSIQLDREEMNMLDSIKKTSSESRRVESTAVSSQEQGNDVSESVGQGVDSDSQGVTINPQNSVNTLSTGRKNASGGQAERVSWKPRIWQIITEMLSRVHDFFSFL